MNDDLYGLYQGFFNTNSRPDLYLDNEVFEEPMTIAPVENTPTDEISILEGSFGDLQGKTIEVELSALLEILPRKRRRIDAYNSLIRILKAEKDCVLTIKSRKTK